MDKVRIYVYPTSIEIVASPYGQVRGGGNISKSIRDMSEFEFNRQLQKWKFKHAYYLINENAGTLVFPRQMLSSIISELKTQKLPYSLEYPEIKTPRSIAANMRPEWTDRPEQESVISALTQTKFSMYGSDLQTGKGKTYCTFRVISTLRVATLIVVDGLVEQWIKEFSEKTLIPPDKVYRIQGAESILRLLQMKPNEYPSVYVASLDTLMPYIQAQVSPYKDWIPYQKFIEMHGIGLKIIDEVHLNFQALVNLDLRSKIMHNRYLSATPERSKSSEGRIFEKIYPPKMFVGGEKYDKYVHLTFYKYQIPVEKPKRFITQHGYNHLKYEMYMVNNRAKCFVFLQTVVFPAVHNHFLAKRKPEQRMLIFASSVMMCEAIRDGLLQEYPHLDVRTFVSGDPLTNLDADIIVGTPKSCGTGRDIADLLTVLNTCSINADPTIKQMLGRLRKLKNGDVPEYIDTVNTVLDRQYAHYKNRKQIYKEKALKYEEFAI